MRAFSIFFCCLFFAPIFGSAQENLGEWRWSQFSLGPEFLARKEQSPGFRLRQSWLGVQWRLNAQLTGELRLGSLEQSGPALWYAGSAGPQRESYGLREAWVDLATSYLDLRAGSMELPWRFARHIETSEHFFPATLAFEPGASLRPQSDLGLKLRNSHGPWLTEFVVHNGESDVEQAGQDGRFWGTARWLYGNDTTDAAAISATAGSRSRLAEGQASLATESQLFPIRDNEELRVRMVELALLRKRPQSLLEVVAGTGQVLQDREKTNFSWGHSRGLYRIKKDWAVLARGEWLQTNEKLGGTFLRRYGVGLATFTANELANFSVFVENQSGRQEESRINVLVRLKSEVLGR